MTDRATVDDVLRRLVREELEQQLGPIRERLDRPRGALRPDEAATYLGCSETTVRDMHRRGEIGGVTIGDSRGLRFPIAELDRWIAEHTRRGRGVA